MLTEGRWHTHKYPRGIYELTANVPLATRLTGAIQRAALSNGELAVPTAATLGLSVITVAMNTAANILILITIGKNKLTGICFGCVAIKESTF